MLITCKNLSLGYDGQAIVQSLDFPVESGDYLWIVGENGSGKTTVIKGILKQLKPLEGQIVFCDEFKHGRIGYLSQESVHKKDFPAGVSEIVLSGNLGGMGLRPFYNSSEKKLAKDAMERLGILDLKEQCYRELSGGQQRRVLLARALCAAGLESAPGNEKIKSGETSLLVLDEPAASLDPMVTQEVYGLLKELNREMGITIIMVSHDTRSAEQYANRILHIEEGVGYYSEISEYLNSERGKKFFGHKQE